MNHPVSFAVRLNGAQGKMAARVHSPSGALEECVVTELERGLCVCVVFFKATYETLKGFGGATESLCDSLSLFTNTTKQSGPLVTALPCSLLQISTLYGSSPERTVSIPLTSNSMALTSQKVLSRSVLENQDRLEIQLWSQHMELDWREARQVGYLSI